MGIVGYQDAPTSGQSDIPLENQLLGEVAFYVPSEFHGTGLPEEFHCEPVLAGIDLHFVVDVERSILLGPSRANRTIYQQRIVHSDLQLVGQYAFLAHLFPAHVYRQFF
jgi:hypothetical protein